MSIVCNICVNDSFIIMSFDFDKTQLLNVITTDLIKFMEPCVNISKVPRVSVYKLKITVINFNDN